MKFATFLLLTSPVWAQLARPVAKAAAPPAPAPAAMAGAAGAGLTRQAFKTLEDGFNTKLGTFNPADTIYILGATRGVYLQGYGVVFSAELDLIQSPTINPFHAKITPEEVVSTHNRKLKQLPLLRQAMKDQLAACAKSLNGLAPTDQVVMVVRLDYQPWENMASMPSQILLRADRQSAAAGNIQVEEQ